MTKYIHYQSNRMYKHHTLISQSLNYFKPFILSLWKMLSLKSECNPLDILTER